MYAAIEYARNGWSVIPGSVWDGHAYTLGTTPTKTDGLVPSMVSQRSYRNAREVHSWWNVAPYSILSRVAEDFDVIQIPAGLLATSIEFARQSIIKSPVVIGPFGARILVSRGAELLPGLWNDLGIDIMPPGVFIPLPPTTIRAGSTRWLREPSELNYQLGDQKAVQEALLEVQQLWKIQRVFEFDARSNSSVSDRFDSA
ncbi:hypothetical protein [Amycolatopsis sp. PS_44_ISF1]|uniref:hypothetical protein n=1 Tax=Amycolatopsis sp. PS_44_ISF1 TaxID=2974917 RepID=UPI0028E053FB|nr:hypothetical protein [Amycolatopsis sp. PS_44_ISF1]MDT8910923.1 hypothetical protein [Amycolatopsis sp. PS_44_ISF1]